jgi:hypothetical protein
MMVAHDRDAVTSMLARWMPRALIEAAIVACHADALGLTASPRTPHSGARPDREVKRGSLIREAFGDGANGLN